MKEWKEYFMGVLLVEGVEGRVVRGMREGERERDEKKNLEKKEIGRMITRIKDKKVAGMDGITNEVWKYGRKKLKE